VLGATITQALFLAVHETSHNLVFKSASFNRWFSIFLNLPIVIPFSIAFRHYHLDHHKYQGIDGLDTDLPTNIELKLANNKISKFIWMTLQIVMYAVRPVIHGKNKLKINSILICNIMIQLLFDLIVFGKHGEPGHFYI
jgi:sphingolipid delta-4 desaturase